jgi:hypothetical protein
MKNQPLPKRRGEFMAICTHRATGAAAISTSLAPGRAFQLLEIRVHLSAAGGAGNFTATVDANAGAAYDITLLTQDMTSVTNLVWTPDCPLHFDSGDEIDFAWANVGTKTYGLEVKFNPL